MYFIVGTIFGSIANYCIIQWSDNKPIVSYYRCNTCKHSIKWYDSIPIISYFLLKGKCRYCHTSISLIYPFVEILTGFLSFAIFYQYGFNYQAILIMFTTWFMLVATVTDIRERIIPNELIVLGLCVIAINSLIGTIEFTNILIGFIPATLLFFISILLEAIMNIDVVIGGGDIKLLFVLGGLWGWFLPVITLVGGCYILVLIYGGVAINNLAEKKQTYTPMMVGFGLFFLYLLLSVYFPLLQF